MAAEYEGTRGLLCYLLGNENNYGLLGMVQKQKISLLRSASLLSALRRCIP